MDGICFWHSCHYLLRFVCGSHWFSDTSIPEGLGQTDTRHGRQSCRVLHAGFPQVAEYREDIEVSIYACRITRVYHGAYLRTFPLSEGVEKFESNYGKRGLACMN